ncbi:MULTISPECIES: hydrogenase maturation peptidase HycI [Methanothermobacter]|mgnify:FL=1|uniref:hydrogenase maturation peptidase HycI n=1 Tax=Methanothermobacter TaxID=145260 RepID=UPI000ADAE679|nr:MULTISPECIES: hydrogenase maturation peptidase HycI [Methanothermobacter]MDK2875227.1 hydrogenase 3 maturation protease [Methanothermobacter sp.]MDN5373549.1 hydrogenase 3 maturation protease [Methanothermobacter sp.]BAZ98780.1 Hydrogenase 3 maturation protease [Methanothermobacter sp. EMTCatA1]HOQ18480.1 hydrogenase maturation peptidase HycI [Methanothermobacter thermautotrophicus]
MKRLLSDFLTDCRRLLVLTVGNELRSDDGLGPYLASLIQEAMEERGHLVINAGTVPENFTGKIRSERPSHILIVDAVEMREEPGTVRLIERDSISEYSISTHAMPLSFLVRYLEDQGAYRIALMGVQPENLEFGTGLSPAVEDAVHDLAGMIISALDDFGSCG